jgi:hypothetical protein
MELSCSSDYLADAKVIKFSFHTVQQQLDQILESQSAIAQALQRRGLSERFELEVDIVSRLFLYKRKQKETS